MESEEETNKNNKRIKYFIIKYIFRLFHIVAFAFIFGNVAYDLFISRRVALDNNKIVNPELKKSNDIYFGLTVAFYIVLILSGLINMILLVVEKKFIKDKSYSLWKYLLITKTFMTIFLTPILDYFISLSTTDQEYIFQTALKIRFSFLLLLTLLSPFLRFYREYYVKPGIAKGEEK